MARASLHLLFCLKWSNTAPATTLLTSSILEASTSGKTDMLVFGIPASASPHQKDMERCGAETYITPAMGNFISARSAAGSEEGWMCRQASARRNAVPQVHVGLGNSNARSEKHDRRLPITEMNKFRMQDIATRVRCASLKAWMTL